MDWIAKHISSAAGFCFGGTYEFDSEHSFYMPPFVFLDEGARKGKAREDGEFYSNET